MKRALFPAAVILLALGAGACGSATSPSTPVSRSQLKAGDIHIAVAITGQGTGVLNFRIGVQNGGPVKETLEFSCGQFFDIEVRDGGSLVWRWSHDKAFTQAPWELELDPRESFSQTTDWDLAGNDGRPLAPGSYESRVFITNSDGGESLVYQTSLKI
ncbi:MAG TPA: BsuPI-related putative proteinase inhibitor [Candidatus Aminicenantes bacterium]|nr:BsuPI-related putative proteinase inhibitor [Candidatus Aminicenantes bacterium]HRY63832.1 BsuPI-related putative proteinase inhibitor [Candidatus Aminicenantes bacterium]HRZ70745.1 BsuPI-related putative proteinase inhibitor [Candidatus Aminicenantes bacterium]